MAGTDPRMAELAAMGEDGEGGAGVQYDVTQMSSYFPSESIIDHWDTWNPTEEKITQPNKSEPLATTFGGIQSSLLPGHLMNTMQPGSPMNTDAARLEPDMFFYAGQPHAQTAYSDAAFDPLEVRDAARMNPSPQDNASRGMQMTHATGYNSLEYQQAVADLGFHEEPQQQMQQSMLQQQPAGEENHLHKKMEQKEAAASLSQLSHAGSMAPSASDGGYGQPARFLAHPAVGQQMPKGTPRPGKQTKLGQRHMPGGVQGPLSLLPMQGDNSTSFGEKKASAANDRRRKDRPERAEHPKSRKLNGGGGKEQKGAGLKDKIKAARVCSLYLTTTDQLQCRYAVKNDEKESNQALPFVQANGYVEYKARYCKKRGSQAGYGNFHVAFVPSDEVIYPFMTSDGAGKTAAAAPGNACDSAGPADDAERLLQIHEIQPMDIERIEITVRLYQSFRGKFPARLAKFGPDEMYHPLYVDSWQDATLLRGMDLDSKITVVQDPDGAYIKYVIHDPDSFVSFTTREGVVFPCPVPTHPERLNDIGMLRMQVTMQITKKSCAVPDTKFDVWIKMKVVQQLSGKKRKFTNMLRPSSQEWCLPKHPTFTAVNASPDHVLHHVLGAECLQGQRAVDLFLALAGEITKRETLSSSYSAFHIAASSGNLGIVRLMLQHELSLIRKRNPDGHTPLHLASMHGHTSIVQALLLAGARLETLTYQHQTAADLAKLAGFDSLAHFLTTQTQKEQTTGCDNVFRAAAVGRTACLQRHLVGRTVVNSCNPEGQTPLMLAALNNHPFAVSTLLDHGADMFIPNRQGDTVLVQAAARGFVDLVAILAHHDPAALKTVTKDGSTALHRAAGNGHVLCTQILISCGADINCRDAAGRTPLDVAIGNNHTCTAAMLDSAAATSPQKAILVSPSTNQSSGSLHIAAESGDVMLVRRLLRGGAHPNKPNLQGDSPIKLGAKRGQFLVLDTLITQHLQAQTRMPEWQDINSPGSDGDFPLHAACTHGAIASLLVLLSSNAVQLNVRAMGGDTALHRTAEVGLPVCAAFLMLAGADANVKNNSGDTPLAVATKLHHGATAQVLSVSRKELVAVSQALDKKPGIPVGRRLSSSEASEQSNSTKGVFKWKGLDEVLSRVWHGTHEARTIARYIKLEEETSGKDGKRMESHAKQGSK